MKILLIAFEKIFVSFISEINLNSQLLLTKFYLIIFYKKYRRE